MERLKLAILRARVARRDFDKRAIRLGDEKLNALLLELRHSLDELDAAASEVEAHV